MIVLLCYSLVEGEEKVFLDFNGVELSAFLQWYANISGKKLLYGDLKQAAKKIYLNSPEPVKKESVEKICLAVLEQNGYTLLKSGEGESEVYKLVETSTVATKPITIFSPAELRELESGDYYVSQVVTIQYLKVDKVVAALRQAKLMDERVGDAFSPRFSSTLRISCFVLFSPQFTSSGGGTLPESISINTGNTGNDFSPKY